ISAYENLISNAERRMIINNEANTFVRISDFLGVIPAITGKIELVYEGELEGPAKVANILIGKAVKTLLLQFFPDPEKAKKSKAPNPYAEIIAWFGNGNSLSLVDDLPAAEYKKLLNSVPGLKALIKQFHPRLSENQQLLLMEFVLHGLAEFSQLNKGFLDNGFAFSDMFNSLFNLQPDDDDIDLDDDRY
ncbi:MAG: magnesium chelatase, partial [Sphingobacteriaceae bacterium]